MRKSRSPGRSGRFPPKRFLGSLSTVGAVFLLATFAVGGSANSLADTDLTELSLEDLMEIEVTSATKSERRLFDVAAAAYVITAEDIRRSGATTLPDILRMAAGVEVTQVDAQTWEVSARGFNGNFSNKLQVLVDGRSIYSPLFAGVYWDHQGTVIEDIERIEVIRGPGATLWGANAVNGIINIITRSAAGTEETALHAIVGTEEKVNGTFRHAGRWGEHTRYRAYAKYTDREGVFMPGTGDSAQGWNSTRAGFRIDREAGGSDTLMIQGGVFENRSDQVNRVPALEPPFSMVESGRTKARGSFLLASWNSQGEEGSEIALHAYFDRDVLKGLGNAQFVNTVDLDFHCHMGRRGNHDFIWGAGYRHIWDRHEPDFHLSFGPLRRTVRLFSAFAQDEISFNEGRFLLTLGSKFEHNSYTGLEVQPNVRGLWKLGESQVFWAAVSRAVRSPNRALSDFRASLLAYPDPVSGMPVLAVGLGNPDIESEILLAYEAGYRIQPAESLTLDVAVYYNDYDNLESFQVGEPFLETEPPPPHLVLPILPVNTREASTRGIEISFQWNASRRWSLAGWYSRLDLDQAVQEGIATDVIIALDGMYPESQFHLRSHLDLPGGFEFDVNLNYVDDLENSTVESYTRVDARLGWRSERGFDVSLGVQNLLDERHPERADFLVTPGEVERNIYGKLTWRF